MRDLPLADAAAAMALQKRCTSMSKAAYEAALPSLFPDHPAAHEFATKHEVRGFEDNRLVREEAEKAGLMMHEVNCGLESKSSAQDGVAHFKCGVKRKHTGEPVGNAAENNGNSTLQQLTINIARILAAWAALPGTAY